MNTFKYLKNISKIQKKFFSTHYTLKKIPGLPKYTDNTKDVSLRGMYIKGEYSDLPNLIFFTEACDLNKNWVQFFTDPQNQFLKHRNIYLLSPRNFGRSDRHPSYDLSEQADDVIRFMYENKISTATIGGHGFGGKLAVAVGCYHAERVTGVFSVDSAPMDNRYFESYQEFKHNIQTLKEIDINTKNEKDIQHQLREGIECPKWRNLFKQNLKQDEKTNKFYWNFELDYLNHNVSFNRADSIGNWQTKHGLYTGRFMAIFAEYSRWVHLNTNTMRFFQVCTRTKGFGHDLFYIPGDENPLNHWVYDFQESEYVTARKILKFIQMWDGVHVLLKDRSEIGNYFIPGIKNSRNNDSDHVYSDYTPQHLHHNWRYSNIYDDPNNNKDK